MAYECLEAGPLACLTFNAANEVAVDAFLKRKIGFSDILNVIELALSHQPDINLDGFDSIEMADRAVRDIVSTYLFEETPKTQTN